MSGSLTIGTKTLKSLQPMLCGDEDTWLNEAFCDKEPLAIKTGEFKQWQTYLPEVSIFGQPQKELAFCRAFRNWYAGPQGDAKKIERSCKSQGGEACGNINERKLEKIEDACQQNVFSIEDKGNSVKYYIWGGITGGLALLYKIIKAIIKKIYSSPDEARNAAKAGSSTIQDMRDAKGFKAKARALFNGVIRTVKAWNGKAETTSEVNQATAAKTVSSNWELARASLIEAEQIMTSAALNDRATEMSTPRIPSVDFLVGTSASASADELLRRFYESDDAFIAYTKLSGFTRFQIPNALSSIQYNEKDLAGSASSIKASIADLEEHLNLTDRLLTASNKMNDITHALSSAHSVDPEKNKRWRNAIVQNICFLEDARIAITVQSSLANLALKHISDKNISQALTELNRSQPLATLKGVISSAIELNRSLALHKGVKVDLSIGKDNEVTIATELQKPLYRILDTLLNNAVVYSDPSKRNNGAKVSIAVRDTAESTFIDVEDNGVGIKNLSLAIAGNRERPDLAFGDGLGLKTSFSLAEENGFSIQYAPRKSMFVLNNGSKFTIRIPKLVPVQRELFPNEEPKTPLAQGLAGYEPEMISPGSIVGIDPAANSSSFFFGESSTVGTFALTTMLMPMRI